MNINGELAPLPRWQPIGRRPTSKSVLAFLRALTQYMLNITTKENTDGMGLVTGLAGCVMEDAKYQAKSANHAPYVKPPDPILPTDLQLAGATAEQRQIIQYNNKVAWENRDHRVKYKGKALDLLLAGGDARTYLAQFWDEDTGFSQRDLKNICDYLRDTYVIPDENDLKTVRDRLAAYKFSGGEVEPTIAFIELSATNSPPPTHSMTTRKQPWGVLFVCLFGVAFGVGGRDGTDVSSVNKSITNASIRYKLSMLKFEDTKE